MSTKNWLNHPDLAEMDPVKKEIMLKLIENAEGKSLTKMAPYLQQATAKMKQENLSFTKEEHALIIDIMTQGMSPSERQQFEKVRQMLLKAHG